MWDRQMDALAPHFRVIRYDLRGHGASPVPPPPYDIADLGADVLALLDALDVERAHVGGVSLGGQVAMWLAANAPERVRQPGAVLHVPALRAAGGVGGTRGHGAGGGNIGASPTPSSAAGSPPGSRPRSRSSSARCAT